MAGNKKTLLAFIIALIGLCIGTIFYFAVSSSSIGTIGTIVRNCTEPTDIRSTVSFMGSEGDIITFKLTSKITQGELQFVIVDSEENIIGNFGQDISEQKLILEKEDEYIVKAFSDSFIGKFRLNFYKK